jgi:hypothetical protein
VSSETEFEVALKLAKVEVLYTYLARYLLQLFSYYYFNMGSVVVRFPAKLPNTTTVTVLGHLIPRRGK